MSSVDVTQFAFYEAAVYTGTAGSAASTAMGYIMGEDAVVVTGEVPDRVALRIQGEKYPLRHANPSRNLTVVVPTTQMDVDLMALALGVTKQSAVVWTGESTDTLLAPQCSVAVIGKDAGGTTFRLDIPYASTTGAVGLSLSQSVQSKMPITFETECGIAGTDAHKPYWTYGDNTATIATGVLTLTKAVTLVKGEGDTTDEITSFVGTAISGDAIIRLKPYSSTYVVTITDTASDVINMIGGVAFAFGGSTAALGDWCDLKKTGTNEFMEVGRYDVSGN